MIGETYLPGKLEKYCTFDEAHLYIFLRKRVYATNQNMTSVPTIIECITQCTTNDIDQALLFQMFVSRI